MSDLERLTEAIARWPAASHDEIDTDGGVGDVVFAAARAYRDLLANGERVWWCEVHGAMGGSDDPGECVYAPRYATACRIDDRLLVDPPTEEECDGSTTCAATEHIHGCYRSKRREPIVSPTEEEG